MDTSLTKIDRDRRRYLSSQADKIERALHKVDMLRIERDARLREWHEDGTSVELLANASRLTRQGVYDAIERVRKGADVRPA